MSGVGETSSREVTPARRGPTITIRPARLSDVGTLAQLYRSQPEESRQMYHPFPFGRFRITAIFTYMTVTRRWVRWMLHHPHLHATIVLVALGEDSRKPVGYATVMFRAGQEGPIAEFGYLVHPAYRGQGIGIRLHEEMVDAALAVGVRKGGGMVISTNKASLKVVRKMGFDMQESDVVDRHAPGARNYVTTADLEEIARKRRAAKALEGSTAPTRRDSPGRSGQLAPGPRDRTLDPLVE